MIEEAVNAQVVVPALKDDPVAAVTELVASFERVMGAVSEGVVACREGCSWCCRGVRVDTSPVEALTIADFVARLPTDERDDLERRIRSASESAESLTVEDRLRRQVPCAFLGQASNCAIYSVRPLNCRGMSSPDAEQCERAYHDMSGEMTVPIDEMCKALWADAEQRLADACEREGLDARPFELSRVVAIALREPDAAARWARGERLFGQAATVHDEADARAIQDEALRLRLIAAERLLRKPAPE